MVKRTIRKKVCYYKPVPTCDTISYCQPILPPILERMTSSDCELSIHIPSGSNGHVSHPVTPIALTPTAVTPTNFTPTDFTPTDFTLTFNPNSTDDLFSQPVYTDISMSTPPIYNPAQFPVTVSTSNDFGTAFIHIANSTISPIGFPIGPIV